MKKWQHLTLVIGIVLIVGAIGALFYYQFLSPQGRAESENSFAKEYGLVLQNYDGKDVRLSAYRGKIMVAYVWASWCPYCAKELENLGTLKAMYGDRIEVVAINRAEPRSVAKSYTDQLTNAQGVEFLLDPQDSFFKTDGGYAMPETVFINEHGEVTHHQRGPMNLEEVSAKLKLLLQ